MNGRDASGRPVSLLNTEDGFALMVDAAVAGAAALRDLSLPPTPELSRSHSWSSRRTTESPSPRTPADVTDPRAGRLVMLGAHPPLLPKGIEATASSALGRHSTGEPMEVADLEVDESSTADASLTTVSAKPVPKRYPCPFVDRLDCREMFTTSGHASRHAKKHTGEKNVPCPRCRKMFARKDNMKQHLKTHESGRAAVAAAAAAGTTMSSTPDEMSGGPQLQQHHHHHHHHHRTTIKSQQKLCDRIRKRGGSPLSPIRTDLAESSEAMMIMSSSSTTTPTTTTTTGGATELWVPSDSLSSCTTTAAATTAVATTKILVRPPLRRASATRSIPRRNSSSGMPSSSSSSSSSTMGAVQQQQVVQQSPTDMFRMASSSSSSTSTSTTSSSSSLSSSLSSSSSSAFSAASLLTPGLDALVIAADVTMRR